MYDDPHDDRPTALPVVSRRRILRNSGVAALLLGCPAIVPSRAAERSVKVATFGGAFEQGFAKSVYPAFTAATGIAVQSVERPEGSQFLFQLDRANKAGRPPMDVCCAAEVELLRGRAWGVWRGLEAKRVGGISQLASRFQPDGQLPIDGVAAMAWYMTLVVNPDEIGAAPDSWAVLWQKRPSAWGIDGGRQSPLFEIAAHLYFGGNEALASTEGIDRVIAKIAEIKPNVKLWWQDEGTMQTALENGEVVGGTYLHDAALAMVRSGTRLRSIFPREGGVEGINFWAQPSASVKTEEAQEFINFCCSPEAQEMIVRKVGSAPVIDRRKTDLTEQEFSAVSSDIPPIPMASRSRVAFADYMERQFVKMVTS